MAQRPDGGPSPLPPDGGPQPVPPGYFPPGPGPRPQPVPAPRPQPQPKMSLEQFKKFVVLINTSQLPSEVKKDIIQLIALRYGFLPAAA